MSRRAKLWMGTQPLCVYLRVLNNKRYAILLTFSTDAPFIVIQIKYELIIFHGFHFQLNFDVNLGKKTLSNIIVAWPAVGGKCLMFRSVHGS